MSEWVSSVEVAMNPPPPLSHPPLSVPSSSTHHQPLARKRTALPHKPPTHPVIKPPLSSRTKTPTLTTPSRCQKPPTTHCSPPHGNTLTISCNSSPSNQPRSPSVTGITIDRIKKILQNDRILNPSNKVVDEIHYLPEGLDARIMDASKANLIDEVAKLKQHLLSTEEELAKLKATVRPPTISSMNAVSADGPPHNCVPEIRRIMQMATSNHNSLMHSLSELLAGHCLPSGLRSDQQMGVLIQKLNFPSQSNHESNNANAMTDADSPNHAGIPPSLNVCSAAPSMCQNVESSSLSSFEGFPTVLGTEGPPTPLAASEENLPLHIGHSNHTTQVTSLPSSSSPSTSTSPTLRSWAEVAKQPPRTHSSPQRMVFEFFKPKMMDQGPVVVPPEEVEDEGSTFWNGLVAGQFLKKKPSFSSVNQAACRMWGTKGLQHVYADGEFFYFKFDNDHSVDKLLSSGPFSIAGKSLHLQKWHPLLTQSIKNSHLVHVWVKLFNIPVHLWTAKGLSHIASALGRPLHADEATENLEKLKFAKICIEIDLNTPLLRSFPLITKDGRTVEIKVEYQGVPKYCINCKKVGHLSSICPSERLGDAMPSSQNQHNSEWTRVTSRKHKGKMDGDHSHDSVSAGKDDHPNDQRKVMVHDKGVSASFTTSTPPMNLSVLQAKRLARSCAILVNHDCTQLNGDCLPPSSSNQFQPLITENGHPATDQNCMDDSPSEAPLISAAQKQAKVRQLKDKGPMKHALPVKGRKHMGGNSVPPLND